MKKYWLSQLLCVGLLTGTITMALERPRPSINQDKIDVIKREMNFPQFIRQLPPDKRVILDWASLLSGFKDAEGTTWRTRADGCSYSRRAEHGALDTRLRSDKGNIQIVVNSLNQGQEDAIDWALWDATNSNAPFVPRKYEPQCFSTLCLIPRQQSTVEFMSIVYGNIAINLTQYGSGNDVRPVARYLQSAMEKAVAANPEQRLPPRPKVVYTVSPTRIKAGETFTVTAKFSAGHQRDPRSFDVANELLSSNIEYEEDLGGDVYKFTAKAAGQGTVAFSLLDKKTLWVFTDTVTVDIDPAQ